MPGLRSFVLAAALVFGATGRAAAQDSARTAGAETLRVFLDCGHCDFDYVRTETRWVEFVRDRTAADVHVLVSQIGTGSGGNEYTIEFTGLGRFAPRADTVRFVSPPSQTSDEVRQGLTRTIQLGLVPFAMRTSAAARLRLSVAGGDDDEDRVTPGNDPWNAWVFDIGVNGSIDREQRQTQAEFGGDFEASRITSMWKAGFEIGGERSESRFELEDRTVTSKRERFDAGAVLVRSFGPHWGAGAEATLSSSTFDNTRRAVRAAPAVEYSVWPYDQATRKQLTLQYSFGVSAFEYREETIFGRMRETRPTHTFVAGYDVRQRWGSANAEFQYSNYVDDAKQFRLEFDGSLSIRIVRGLELELEGRASQIRDQLSIAKRDATDEEVLLELRDLRTDYRFDASIGFNFTFGSIFNSVVNPRFGSGAGSVLR